jgi:hypothetical protein
VTTAVHTATYSPNVDTHEAFADATNELSTVNGYTANGIAIAGKTSVYNVSGVITFDMDDTTVTWTAVTGSWCSSTPCSMTTP